jgi:hypothetical protein
MVEKINHAVAHNLVFGSESFKDMIQEQACRRVRWGKPGRPRLKPFSTDGSQPDTLSP